MPTYTVLRRLYNFCALIGLCVRIRLLRSKRLVRMNTSFARKSDFAYVYGLCAISGLCIHIRILLVKRILRTCTACALKADCGFLQRLGDLFDVAMMFVDSFDVATTVVLVVRQFV